MRKVILICMSALCLFLVGCAPQDPVVGKWKTEVEEGQKPEEVTMNEAEFKADKTFTLKLEGKDLKGTWSQTDPSFIELKPDQGETLTATINSDASRITFGPGTQNSLAKQ